MQLVKSWSNNQKTETDPHALTCKSPEKEKGKLNIHHRRAFEKEDEEGEKE